MLQVVRILSLIAACLVSVLSLTEVWLTQVPQYVSGMESIKHRDGTEAIKLDKERLVNEVKVLQEEESILEDELVVLRKQANGTGRAPKWQDAQNTSACSDLGPIMDRQANLIGKLVH